MRGEYSSVLKLSVVVLFASVIPGLIEAGLSAERFKAAFECFDIIAVRGEVGLRFEENDDADFYDCDILLGGVNKMVSLAKELRELGIMDDAMLERLGLKPRKEKQINQPSAGGSTSGGTTLLKYTSAGAQSVTTKTAAPAPVSTSAPAPVSTSAPAAVSTSATSPVSTSSTSPVSTSAPAPVSTSAPAAVSTSAPAAVSTSATSAPTSSASPAASKKGEKRYITRSSGKKNSDSTRARGEKVSSAAASNATQSATVLKETPEPTAESSDLKTTETEKVKKETVPRTEKTRRKRVSKQDKQTKQHLTTVRGSNSRDKMTQQISEEEEEEEEEEEAYASALDLSGSDKSPHAGSAESDDANESNDDDASKSRDVLTPKKKAPQKKSPQQAFETKKKFSQLKRTPIARPPPAAASFEDKEDDDEVSVDDAKESLMEKIKRLSPKDQEKLFQTMSQPKVTQAAVAAEHHIDTSSEKESVADQSEDEEPDQTGSGEEEDEISADVLNASLKEFD